MSSIYKVTGEDVLNLFNVKLEESANTKEHISICKTCNREFKDVCFYCQPNSTIENEDAYVSFENYKEDSNKKVEVERKPNLVKTSMTFQEDKCNRAIKDANWLLGFIVISIGFILLWIGLSGTEVFRTWVAYDGIPGFYKQSQFGDIIVSSTVFSGFIMLIMAGRVIDNWCRGLYKKGNNTVKVAWFIWVVTVITAILCVTSNKDKKN